MLQHPVFYDSGARSAALCSFFFPFLFLSVRDGWRKQTILSDRASLEEQTVFIGPLVNIAPRKNAVIYLSKWTIWEFHTNVCGLLFFPPLFLRGTERLQNHLDSPVTHVPEAWQLAFRKRRTFRLTRNRPPPCHTLLTPPRQRELCACGPRGEGLRPARAS